MNLPCFKPFLLLLLLGFSLSASGQIFNQNAENLLARGDRYFTKEQYVKAETVYAQLFREDQGNADIMRRLGVVKVFNRKYREAIDILEFVLENTDSIDYFLCYQLASAYHHRKDFERAAVLYRLASVDSSLAVKCETGILQSEFASRMQERKPGNVIVQRLDTLINTQGHEIVPQLLNDTLLIYRSESAGSNFSLPLFKNSLGYLRYATLNESDPPVSGMFEYPRKVKLLSGEEWLQSPVMPGENKYLYYSLKQRKYAISDYSKNDNIGWGSKQIGAFYADEASVAILPGREVAYYIKSEEVQGFIQKDIYEAVLDSAGNWIEKERLRKPVNSDYNEYFLFWCEEEQALYFSSDRREGSMGGFDIFRSERDTDGKLKKPVNLGFPVNTLSDDVCFTKSGNQAFYASNNGDNNFDLYKVTYQKPVPPLPPPAPWYEKYTDLPGVTRIDEWVACGHIYFETSLTRPDNSSKAYKDLHRALIENPELKVRLTGYADWTGDAVMNRKISYERASKLFFALCMDGVKSDQMELDFKGSDEPRTEKQFEKVEICSLAKAANRCVAIEVIDHGGTYLYVSENQMLEPVVHAAADAQYAILLAVSEKDHHSGNPGLDSLEMHVVDNFRLFHTPMTSDLNEVVNMHRRYAGNYPGAYIFEFRY